MDGIFLQDAGLLHALGKADTGLELIWSYLGVARNGTENLLRYQFLRSLAPVRIATDRVYHCQEMAEYGIPPLLMYGRISYNTINRLCYYTYESILYGSDCGRTCLEKKQRMESKRFQMEMSVDGYLLGKKYIYTESEMMPELIYAENYEEGRKRIALLTKEDKDEDFSSNTGL